MTCDVWIFSKFTNTAAILAVEWISTTDYIYDRTTRKLGTVDLKFLYTFLGVISQKRTLTTNMMMSFTFYLLLVLIEASSSMYLIPQRNLEAEPRLQGKMRFSGTCDNGYASKAGKQKAFRDTCLHCGGGCCNNMDKRIAGGTNAARSEFPWSAALFKPNGPSARPSYQFFCGGVLIRPDVVLTAAHCVARFAVESYEDLITLAPGKLKVSVGELDIQISDTGSRLRNVESLINVRQIQIHSDYQRDHSAGGLLVYDVALLTLEREISSPIACLDEEYDLGTRVNLTNHVCFGIGHGRLAGPNSPVSSRLRKVPVHLFDVGLCDRTLQSHFDKYLCARSETGATVACKMDSGSPVVCRSDPNDDCSPYFVSGIFSFRKFGDNCDGSHSVLSNMLDQSGALSAASFVMDSVKFAFGENYYYRKHCNP